MIDEQGNEDFGFVESGGNSINEQSTLIDNNPPDKEVLVEKSGYEHAIYYENTFLCFGPRHVPYLLFLSDFIICNGAGMTINFFPIFFQQEYGLSPSQVNLLWVAQSVLIFFLSFTMQKISL